MQPIQVGSLRTDYMLQLPRTSKQQTHTATTTTNDTINSSNNNASAIIDKRLRYFLVEINTIAAGFIDLGPKTTATHRYVVINVVSTSSSVIITRICCVYSCLQIYSRSLRSLAKRG